MSSFAAIVSDPIEFNALVDLVTSPEAGAVVTFQGVVRNHDDGKGVTSIFYECYDDLAIVEMQKIVREAELKVPGAKVAAVHRKGLLSVGEVSVAVAASSAHRAEAFEAVRFVIDEIKNRVPVWKKQNTQFGEDWK